jgi:hypothetical protein
MHTAFYFQVTAVQTAYHSVNIINYRNETSLTMCRLGLTVDAYATKQLRLESITGGNSSVTYATFDYSNGTWYKLELEMEISSSVVVLRARINDNLQAGLTQTINNPDMGRFTRLILGQKSAGSDNTVYIDNVVVDYAVTGYNAWTTIPYKFEISAYEASNNGGEWTDPYFLTRGSYPSDYGKLAFSQYGTKWRSIQIYNTTINPDGTLTINHGYSMTYPLLLTRLNAWLTSGYKVVLELGVENWISVSNASLKTFMIQLNTDLKGKIIWVNLNEFNSQWRATLYHLTFPMTLGEAQALNVTSTNCKKIRDGYGLHNIELCYQPNHDISGIAWERSIDSVKGILDQGDYYTMSSYWGTAGNHTDIEWKLDADNFIAYIVNGTDGKYSGKFGGYTGKSGFAYNDKPWIFVEFGHQAWTDLKSGVWIEQLLYDISNEAPFIKMIMFWSPINFTALAKLAPLFETPVGVPSLVYNWPLASYIGIFGLVGCFITPAYAVHKIKEGEYFGAFSVGVPCFLICMALFVGWILS